MDGCPPSVGTPALARRCDVRTKYASHLASRAALHLDLFEQPGRKRVFQHPARSRERSMSENRDERETMAPLGARARNAARAGIGGQGVLPAGQLRAEAAVRAGHDVKKSEVHGMAQRGGIVTSHVRMGRKGD